MKCERHMLSDDFFKILNSCSSTVLFLGFSCLDKFRRIHLPMKPILNRFAFLLTSISINSLQVNPLTATGHW